MPTNDQPANDRPAETMNASQPRTRPRLREFLSDRMLALMLALGFSCGLPFPLVYAIQSARLSDAGIAIATITMFSYVTLTYSVKFLWSPIVDIVDLPVLAKLLGRRRAWMLLAQVLVAAGFVGMALSDPSRMMWWLIGCSFFTAFAGATQDIVIDGWRIDAAPAEKQGMMLAAYQFGYRLAFILANIGSLYVATYVGWQLAYMLMAVFMLVGIIACIASPRLPERQVARNRDPVELFVEPLVDLFKRYGLWLIAICLLVAIFRLPDFLTGVLANPLYLRELNFTKIEVANVSKVYGVVVSILGAFAGGYAIARFKLMHVLLVGGIAAATSHLCLAWLAASGHRMDLLILSISVENFAGAFAGTALMAYMSSLTSPAFAASQYALLSSLYALPGKLIGGLSGTIVTRIGYAPFFVAASMLVIPIAVLCLIVMYGQRRGTARADDQAEERPLPDGAAERPA